MISGGSFDSVCSWLQDETATAFQISRWSLRWVTVYVEWWKEVGATSSQGSQIHVQLFRWFGETYCGQRVGVQVILCQSEAVGICLKIFQSHFSYEGLIGKSLPIQQTCWLANTLATIKWHVRKRGLIRLMKFKFHGRSLIIRHWASDEWMTPVKCRLLHS